MDIWRATGNPMGDANSVAASFAYIDVAENELNGTADDSMTKDEIDKHNGYRQEITESQLESMINEYRDGHHTQEIDEVVAKYAPEIQEKGDVSK